MRPRGRKHIRFPNETPGVTRDSKQPRLTRRRGGRGEKGQTIAQNIPATVPTVLGFFISEH